MFQKKTIISFGKLEQFPPQCVENTSPSLRTDWNVNLKPMNLNASQRKHRTKHMNSRIKLVDDTFKPQDSEETSGECCKYQRINISMVMCHE